MNIKEIGRTHRGLKLNTPENAKEIYKNLGQNIDENYNQ